jgi:hypothetical protein
LACTTACTVELIVKPTNTTAGWVFAKTIGGDNGYALESASSKWDPFLSTNGTSYTQSTQVSQTTISTSRYDYLTLKYSASSANSLTEPTTKFTHGCGVAYGGYLWAVGGHTGAIATPTAVMQRYDPATGVGGTWSAATSMPTARWGPSCALVGSVLYVMGGNTDGSGTTSAKVESYDLSVGLGGAWTGRTDLPANAKGQGSSAVYVNSRIHIFMSTGGTDYNYAYDPTNDTSGWVAKTGTGQNDGTWQSAVTDGTYAYLFDGSNKRQHVARYNPVADTWNGTWGSTPYAAWAGVAAFDGTYLYYGLGRVGDSATPMHRDLYRVDTSTAVFTQLTPDTCEGDAFAYGIISGKLYVAGKRSIGYTETLADGYVGDYNISGAAWDTTCPMFELHVNGVYENGYLMSTALHASAQAFTIGEQANGLLPENAKVDEVRVSNTFRPAGYALTMYNNLMAPATFATAGALQTISSGSGACSLGLMGVGQC